MNVDALRVLVVDDESDLADMLALTLRLEGYEVEIAHDAADAAQRVDAFLPHCVLFDVHMPGLDGLDLAQRLRAEHGDDLVLVAMSGRDPQTSTRVAGAFEEADHYLKKPIDTAELLRLLPRG